MTECKVNIIGKTYKTLVTDVDNEGTLTKYIMDMFDQASKDEYGKSTCRLVEDGEKAKFVIETKMDPESYETVKGFIEKYFHTKCIFDYEE